jgi:ribosomal protein S16
MPFADSFGADQFVFNRVVHRRKRKARDGRNLGRRIGFFRKFSEAWPLQINGSQLRMWAQNGATPIFIRMGGRQAD